MEELENETSPNSFRFNRSFPLYLDSLTTSISSKTYYYGTSVTHNVPYNFKNFCTHFSVSGGYLSPCLNEGTIYVAIKITNPTSEDNDPTFFPPNPLSSQHYQWYENEKDTFPIEWCIVSTSWTGLITLGKPSTTPFSFHNYHDYNFEKEKGIISFNNPYFYFLVKIPFTNFRPTASIVASINGNRMFVSSSPRGNVIQIGSIVQPLKSENENDGDIVYIHPNTKVVSFLGDTTGGEGEYEVSIAHNIHSSSFIITSPAGIPPFHFLITTVTPFVYL